MHVAAYIKYRYECECLVLLVIQQTKGKMSTESKGQFYSPFNSLVELLSTDFDSFSSYFVYLVLASSYNVLTLF